jgi:hypothetical protein
MTKKLKLIFFGCAILIAAFDLLSAYTTAAKQLTDRTTVPLHSLGFQFAGLADVFKGVHTVGYYTDKDLDNNPLAVAQFEQAQYMLVPTVLDLNNTSWHWVIFDCTSQQAAMQAIQHLGFTPLGGRNGIMLALNPHGL